MTAISAFRVTQHSQICSLFFRNQIQCIALYQVHNSQALLNLRRGYFSFLFRKIQSSEDYSTSDRRKLDMMPGSHANTAVLL